MGVRILNVLKITRFIFLGNLDNQYTFRAMKKSEKSTVNVLVLSSQKGCFLMAELLKNSGYIFRFADGSKEIK